MLGIDSKFRMCLYVNELGNSNFYENFSECVIFQRAAITVELPPDTRLV